MELLLWFWLYDHRWFFNTRPDLTNYKYILSIPFLLNIGVAFVIISTVTGHDILDICHPRLVVWMYSRSVLCVLMSIILIAFIMKIHFKEKQEKEYFKNAIKIYPEIKSALDDYDYWIKEQSLISTPGLILLVLASVSYFWSVIMFKFLFLDDKIVYCHESILYLIKYDSVLSMLGNIPLIIVLVSMFVIKISSLVIANTCPRLLRCCSNVISKNN